jgi:peptidoglycan/LPS O-acetylase OafA/YrhL
MLDTYRFLLALCVVEGHLLKAGPPGLAWQAVFAFYVLSGFLMTLILNESYGFGARNFARFWINRILRLYPSYYVLFGMTVAYIVYVSPANQLNGALSLPQTTAEWLKNLFIVGLTGLDQDHVPSHRIVPPAWSLAIELVCYALLSAYFARSRARLKVLLGIGLVIAAIHYISVFRTMPAHYGFLDHYTVTQAGLIPFALGGLAYFYRSSRWFEPTPWRICLLVLLLILNASVGYISSFHSYVAGLYIALVLNFILITLLYRFDTEHGKSQLQSVLGGAAYPLFISHWFVGTVIFLHTIPLRLSSVTLFLLSLIGSLLFSLVLYWCVDRNVNELRKLIKQRRSNQSIEDHALRAIAIRRSEALRGQAN